MSKRSHATIRRSRAKANRLRFLVTAGPTREPIDPVRFISNRSSGRMGYAVASRALARGHAVVLVTGPVSLEPPAGAEVLRVETASQMNRAVQAAFRRSDCLVMAAAVADYAPANPSKRKIKKSRDTVSLTLRKNPDIVAAAAARKGPRIVVGFAVETESLLENARRKLARKGLDLIVANDAGAFDSGVSTVHFLSPDGSCVAYRNRRKTDTAEALVRWVETACALRRAGRVRAGR